MVYRNLVKMGYIKKYNFGMESSSKNAELEPKLAFTILTLGSGQFTRVGETMRNKKYF